MHVKNKRKLGIALVLFTLLLLIAGTFAFTAFNQRAINDRLRDNLGEVGGRVHDYYNRDTENKDVFVENYGEEPIMARVRLSEFMAIRARGEENFNSIVPTAVRESVETWTTYIPSTESLSIRTGESAVFNQYANLTFGWTRQGEHASWYLPTFNHVENDLMTAAAGHARDYIAGTGATDGETDGATHPGTGEDAYWQEGETSSYLLDAAEMTEAAHDIRGSYYYAIHVNSQLITPDRDFENEPESGEVGRLLRGIRNNAVDDNGGLPAENPDADEPSPISAFNFESMNPGRLFTTSDGQQFRYLEDMGEGNHLIIRNEVIPSITWNGKDAYFNTWLATETPQDLQDIVQPVANNFITGNVTFDSTAFEWLGSMRNPTNLTGAAAIDFTAVVPGGARRAFALSLADVIRFSGPGRGFPNNAERGAGIHWWLRTPSTVENRAWETSSSGGFHGSISTTGEAFSGRGVRPALIIHQ